MSRACLPAAREDLSQCFLRVCQCFGNHISEIPRKNGVQIFTPRHFLWQIWWVVACFGQIWISHQLWRRAESPRYDESHTPDATRTLEEYSFMFRTKKNGNLAQKFSEKFKTLIAEFTRTKIPVRGCYPSLCTYSLGVLDLSLTSPDHYPKISAECLPEHESGIFKSNCPSNLK